MTTINLILLLNACAQLLGNLANLTAALMRYAFDTLNSHLPDERVGFYEEACTVASQPGFPLDTRALIEAEHAKWARVH